MGAEQTRIDLLPRTLDMLVLKMAIRGDGHGYAIAQLLQQLSGGLPRVEEGSRYPTPQHYRVVTGTVASLTGFAR